MVFKLFFNCTTVQPKNITQEYYHKNKYFYFQKFFVFLPAIHEYELKFYLPTVLPSNYSCTNCSRCNAHDASIAGEWKGSWLVDNESKFSNLELAATGSPDMQLHSTAQDSQYHCISVPD